MQYTKYKLVCIATGMWHLEWQFAELCKGIFIWPRNNTKHNK